MDKIQLPSVQAPDPSEGKFDNLQVEQRGGMIRVTAPLQPDPADKPEEKKDERPAWLPENFKSPEDFVAAYKELQRKQTPDAGKPQEKKSEDKPKPEEKKPEEKPAEEKKDDQKPEEKPKENEGAQQANDILEAAGFKREDLDKEWRENGGLTEASYKKLGDAGFNRDLVDAYIEGQKAIAGQFLDKVFKEAGGTLEAYTEMTNWVAKQGQSEVDAYNKIADSGDTAAMMALVKGTYARYKAAVGTKPALIHGDTPANTGDKDVFRSMAEYIAAMKDPRYAANDPAYHAELDRKLARSNI